MFNLAEFRPGREITSDEILRFMPSAYATSPHASRSELYEFVPTSTLMNIIMERDFVPVELRQQRTRYWAASSYAVHMLRFQHRSRMNLRSVGGVIPEIVIVNSHNGMCRFGMYIGLFRLICLNGLVAGEDFDCVRAKHIGNIQQIVTDGLEHALTLCSNIDETLDLMQSTQLHRQDQLDFANNAANIAWPGGDSRPHRAPFPPELLLYARRDEDKAEDVWTVYNRVQENIVSGGVSGRKATGRKYTSRPISNVQRNLQVNRGLFDLAVEYAKAA